MMLSPDEAQRARALSGSITMRMGEATTVSLGFSEGAGSLTARVDGASEPAFLVASGTRGGLGFDRVAGSGFAVKQNVGHGIALTVTAEQGHAWRTSYRDVETPWDQQRNDGYAAFGLSAEKRAGSLRLSLGANYMREEGTLLGARFSSLIGTAEGKSLFIDSGVALEPGNGWRLGALFRQGFTNSGGADLRTNAWSIDGEKRGVIDRNDRLAVRVSQPLRVESGGIGVRLPTSYDYATHSATWTMENISLAPRGRQIDAETVYARPLGLGWITTNAYWRKDSGNLAWFPDEIGGAVRYLMNF